MMNYLQQNFSASFNIPWPAIICILMLFISFHAHAAHPHKKTKKPPVVTQSVSKNSDKRKRSSKKVSVHSHTSTYSNQRKISKSADKAPTGVNPFAQRKVQNLNITDGMHPQISAIQDTKLTAAKRKVISKLMQQLGKPYHYGGASPQTGFDCSGLVKYAYSDQLKTSLPRTADNMFSMSAEQAQKIKKEELHTGDLVFFRTNRSRNHAGHVGVYLGDGEFIQAPRTGQDIQISRLDDDYWQDHYIGARRVLLAYAVK